MNFQSLATNRQPRTTNQLASESLIDGLPQRGECLRRSGEEPFRILALLDHVPVNRVALVKIEPQSRQILQPQIAIAIERCVLEPSPHVRGMPGVVSKQLDRGMNPDLPERVRDGGVRRV